jgi:hypothetical protein
MAVKGESFPDVEILIVTFRRDRAYMPYNLRSIRKYARGFRGVTLVVPDEDKKLFSGLARKFGCRLITVPEPRDKGMLNHMIVKCSAEQFCQADYILHTDADCVFCAPVTPLDYFVEGKPILLCRPYSAVLAINPPHAQWQTRAEKALGFPITHDFMVRQPIIHRRELYPAVRQRVEAVQGRGFADFVFSCENKYPQGFAEFPTLGAYAYKHLADRYQVVDIGTNAPPPNKVIQGWSHGGLDHRLLFADGTHKRQRERFEEAIYPKWYRLLLMSRQRHKLRRSVSKRMNWVRKKLGRPVTPV